MNLNKIYSLNSDYKLKHDKHRCFISSGGNNKNEGSEEWNSIIHPEQAKIFSFFTHGLSLRESIENLSKYIEASFDETLDIIKPYIYNQEEFHTSFDDNKFNIPRNLIIQDPTTYKKLDVGNFEYEILDFYTERMYTSPRMITLMISNKCVTDCIYCYADTKHQPQSTLDFVIIAEIIKDAYDNDIDDIGLIGGEVFNHPNWKEILKEMRKYNFQPDIISTKKPLKEQDIKFLLDIGIQRIQLSLDSFNENILAGLLSTNISYKNKIIESLELFHKHDFDIQIAITLTKYNSDIKDLINLLDFLKNYNSIESVDIGPAFYSLYKDINFSSWGISKKKFQEISDFCLKQKDYYPFTINLDDSYTERGFYSCTEGSKHFPGAKCSANQSHMFILPDGKVTICEQLYWNKKFIVGDITKNSISEIWNSPESLYFQKLSLDDFSENSACKSCDIFDDCHKNVNKCWADIIKAYGVENWDYPDPRCAFAPEMHNNLSF